ncbi:tRNA threonylcarbamoyladenosine biosynthesis protein TsaB [Candidatus Johnevansia muelleri]|uniref:tRNA threonylcarbamoyladenosine biosynthesis protein TsaB n=1 Tax=Candidatus Johnevansia muelleri TaxID=1495769 RepID=A0A078KEV7_9GAMM|nr:tRNA threonylcarbamoyladenosine biosynthesis protein TsaB [Candidatus Evansia muelleri]
MITIIAIDASTIACSVALLYGYNNNYSIIGCYEIINKKQMYKIIPMVNILLYKAGINIKKIDCIAYGKGPGSFTGIKIASSIAQGLALGVDCPLFAISTLEAIALNAWHKYNVKYIISIINNTLNQVLFLSLFKINNKFILPLPIISKNIFFLKNKKECFFLKKILDNLIKKNFFFMGSGLYILNTIKINTSIINMIDINCEPDAAYIVRIAAKLFLSGSFNKLSFLEKLPCYLYI